MNRFRVPLLEILSLAAGILFLLNSGCTTLAPLGKILGSDSTITANIATLSATPTGHAILLNWTSSEDISVVMIRKSSSDFPSSITDNSLVATISVTANSGSYLDEAVTPDVKMYYTLFLGDSSGKYSAKISTASATVAPPALSSAVSISDFTASENSGVIYLSYACSSDVKQIMIRRSANENPSTTQSAVLVATASVVGGSSGVVTDNASLTARSTYYYSIFAADSSGRFSDTAVTRSITIKPSPASAFTKSRILPSGYQFSWTNPTLESGDQVIVRESTANIPNSIDSGSSPYSGTGASFAIPNYSADDYAATHNYSVFIKTESGLISEPVSLSFYEPATIPYLVPTTRTGSGSFAFMIISQGRYANYKRWTLVSNTHSNPQNSSDGTILFSGLADTGQSVTINKTGLDVGQKYFVRLFVTDRNDHAAEPVSNFRGQLEYVLYPAFLGVTNLSGTSLENHVTLHFSLPNAPIKSMQITRQLLETVGAPEVVVFDGRPTENATSILDTATLTHGATYRYQIILFGDYDTTDTDIPSISDGQVLDVIVLDPPG